MSPNLLLSTTSAVPGTFCPKQEAKGCPWGIPAFSFQAETASLGPTLTKYIPRGRGACLNVLIPKVMMHPVSFMTSDTGRGGGN